MFNVLKVMKKLNCHLVIASVIGFTLFGIAGSTCANPLLEAGDSTVVMEANAHEKTVSRLIAEKEYRLAFEMEVEVLAAEFDEQKCNAALLRIREVYAVVSAQVINNSMPAGSSRIIGKEEAQRVMREFDDLKYVVQSLEAILSQAVKTTLTDKNLQMLKELRALKDAIKQRRTQYLSYDVVAPYVLETARLVEEACGFWNDNEDDIIAAGLYLQRGVHGEWLKQSNQDVRMKFAEVIKSIKSELSESEFEELKILSSLSDSADPSKGGGADLWWNGEK